MAVLSLGRILMPHDLPVVYRSSVIDEWTTPAGFFKPGYHAVAFDLAMADFTALLGCGYDDIERTGNSVFMIGTHVRFWGHAHRGDNIDIAVRMLDHDAKRMQSIAYMFCGGEKLIATGEFKMIHVDMKIRRSSEFPLALRNKISQLKSEHDQIDWPPVRDHTEM
ncbi:MAG: thioesterase family protein [Alphaproteobacteria bacterium]